MHRLWAPRAICAGVGRGVGDHAGHLGALRLFDAVDRDRAVAALSVDDAPALRSDRRTTHTDDRDIGARPCGSRMPGCLYRRLYVRHVRLRRTRPVCGRPQALEWPQGTPAWRRHADLCCGLRTRVRALPSIRRHAELHRRSAVRIPRLRRRHHHARTANPRTAGDMGCTPRQHPEKRFGLLRRRLRVGHDVHRPHRHGRLGRIRAVEQQDPWRSAAGAWHACNVPRARAVIESPFRAARCRPGCRQLPGHDAARVCSRAHRNGLSVHARTGLQEHARVVSMVRPDRSGILGIVRLADRGVVASRQKQGRVVAVGPGDGVQPPESGIRAAYSEVRHYEHQVLLHAPLHFRDQFAQLDQSIVADFRQDAPKDGITAFFPRATTFSPPIWPLHPIHAPTTSAATRTLRWHRRTGPHPSRHCSRPTRRRSPATSNAPSRIAAPAPWSSATSTCYGMHINGHRHRQSWPKLAHATPRQ